MLCFCHFEPKFWSSLCPLIKSIYFLYSYKTLVSFYHADIGAWKYIEEQRHAYFDKMQVMIINFLILPKLLYYGCWNAYSSLWFVAMILVELISWSWLDIGVIYCRLALISLFEVDLKTKTVIRSRCDV